VNLETEIAEIAAHAIDARMLAEIAEKNVMNCDIAIKALFAAIRYNENLNSAFYWRAEAYRIRVQSAPARPFPPCP